MEEKNLRQIFEEVAEDICDNYCKYSDTANDQCMCDKIRDGENCPLDKIFYL